MNHSHDTVADLNRRPAKNRRYPPGPHSRFPGEPILAYRRDPLDYLSRLTHDYGDIVHLRFGLTHLYVLNHPDYIKDVLMTHQRRFTGLAFEAVKSITGEGLLSSQGEAHRRQRRLVQPSFGRERIPMYGNTIVSHALRWCENHPDGAVVEMREELAKLTLGIIGETMFGAVDASVVDEVRAVIESGADLFGPVSFLLARYLERLPLPASRRFIEARERLDTRVYHMIRRRREQDDNPGDLLASLLLAHDEDGDGTGLTDQQLRDEIMTIFVAGHETTSTALTWAWYLLARHPEVESRLHAELERVLGDRPPTSNDLPSLVYTGRVFTETLRLYSPVSMIFRRTLTDHQVDGYTIRPGSVVLLSQYVMHHDPRFYAAPDEFNPDRWTPEERGKRPRFSYFPFGGGARVCIGEGFAHLEGVLVLATLAQQFRAKLVAITPVVPNPSVGMRPRDGLHVRLERRGDGRVPSSDRTMLHAAVGKPS